MRDEQGRQTAVRGDESTPDERTESPVPPVPPVSLPEPTAARTRPGLRDIRPRDVAAGLFIAVLLAASPLTPNEWGVSLAIGLAMGAAWVGYRTWLHPAAADAVGRRGALASLERVPLLVWACVVTWLAAFAPTLEWMYHEWTGSVWQNNHGIFVPVVMAMLVRSALRRDPGGEDEPSAWGFVLLGAGLLLALVDSAAQTRYLPALGLVISLPGLSLLLLGRRRTYATRVAWLMGIFMIPVPTTAFHHVFLRNFTAAAATPVLQWIGLSTLRQHSVITLPDAVFVVGDACSGFATLYSAFAVSVFMACFCESRWRRVLLLLSFAPLALAANVLRALVLILLAVFADKGLLDTALHEASGVMSFFLVLLILYRISDRERLQGAFA